MAKKLVIASGGTGGHLYPALVLAREARERGFSVWIFLGDRRIQLDLSDFEVVHVKSGPLAGLGIRGVSGLLKMGLGAVSSARHLLAIGREGLIVLASGSYASAPVLLAARPLGIRYALIEQNSIPGRVVRKFAPGAETVFLSFPGTERRLGSARTRVTGNPIRPMKRYDAEEAKVSLGFHADRPLVLCIGGSLGARLLAERACEAARRLPDVQFLVQTGDLNYGDLRARFGETGENHRLVQFIEDMGLAYSAADLAVSRAGGGVIAEMATLSLPAVLVPLRIAADDHQLWNARALEGTGSAVLVEENELTPDGLADRVGSLLRSPETLEAMRESLRSHARPDAASSIIKVLQDL
jgi:UDP-N-acetylglucosamine--N-acetylmuramyl-(pentapeptide) pyrophosphoryl-undecaprenol N-acetylglucosamine transferase